MDKLDQVRWGIIGCGDVTEVKSGPGLQKAEGSSLVAVMRRNGRLAEDYAKRHGVAKWYSDAQALIDDPDVNAIYVATPPDSHATYVVAAAKAGKPVYVEKPMGRSYQECVSMVAACEEADVGLYVAYYRRALPRFLKIKSLIESGAIGDVRYVKIQQHQYLRDDELAELKPWRVIESISGGGKFLDYGSHTLDIMAYLLGDITYVDGTATNGGGAYDVEDTVTANLTFGENILGTGTWCFAAFEDDDKNEIVGSIGKLKFSIFGTEPVELRTRSGIETFDIKPPAHIQQPLIQTIVDELRGIGECHSTGLTAAKTNHIMDQVLAGYKVQSGKGV